MKILTTLLALLFLCLFSRAAMAADNESNKLHYTEGDGSFFVVKVLGTEGKGYRANLAKGQPDLVARYQNLLYQIESRRLVLLQEYHEFVATFVTTLNTKMDTQEIPAGVRLADHLKLVINELSTQIPSNPFLQLSIKGRNMLGHLEASRYLKTELLKVSRLAFPHDDKALLRPNISEIINLTSYQARAILIETTLAMSPTLADKGLNYKNPHSFDFVDPTLLASDVAEYNRFYHDMIQFDPNDTYGQRVKNGFTFTSEKSYQARAFEASEAQWEIDRQSRAEQRVDRSKHRAIREQNRKTTMVNQAARSSNWASMLASWTDPNTSRVSDSEALLAAKDAREAVADTNQIQKDALTDAQRAIRRKQLASHNVPTKSSCSKFYNGK